MVKKHSIIKKLIKSEENQSEKSVIEKIFSKTEVRITSVGVLIIFFLGALRAANNEMANIINLVFFPIFVVWGIYLIYRMIRCKFKKL